MTKLIDEILAEIEAGRPVIVVDEYDRENEADLVMSAETVTKSSLIFAMLWARGLMCLPCSGEILDRLEIPIMVQNTTDPLETPFTVSIDAKTTTTGMSVDDRIKTIRVVTDPDSSPSELQRPGHLFPLRARDDLLLARRGHTETSIELMKLAGLREIAVIVEIMNEDGTMTKGHQITDFAKKFGLKVISVGEVYGAVYHSGI